MCSFLVACSTSSRHRVERTWFQGYVNLYLSLVICVNNLGQAPSNFSFLFGLPQLFLLCCICIKFCTKPKWGGWDNCLFKAIALFLSNAFFYSKSTLDIWFGFCGIKNWFDFCKDDWKVERWKKRLGEGEGGIYEEEGKNVYAIMINIKFIV